MIVFRTKSFGLILPDKVMEAKERQSENTYTFGKIAGSIALGGLALAGAKKGLMGGKIQQGVNKMWASAGQSLGSQSMVTSGVKGIREGAYAEAKAAGNFTELEAKKWARQESKDALQKYKIT